MPGRLELVEIGLEIKAKAGIENLKRVAVYECLDLGMILKQVR